MARPRKAPRDLTGKRVGRLTVIRCTYETTAHGNYLWECLCDCSRTAIVASCYLIDGRTRSCGCLHRETASANRKAEAKHGHASGSGTREYSSWRQMKNRCLNPKHHAFRHYGGRGVTVCERWMDFTNFLADMGPRPEGRSLDRIDPWGNYEPGNCRWGTLREQVTNRRT